MNQNHLGEIQSGLSPTKRLNQIVEHSMCIGCGICQSVAGPGVIKMEIVENGNFRPIGSSNLTHDQMDRIIDICPGTRVDGLPESLMDENSNFDSVWGVWREIYFAWSGEPEVRHISATGGVLTGLALYLVESGEVDFVLHATEHEDHPAFGERWISRNREDVMKGSGSRYGPTATLIDIVEIITKAEKDGETFAFIGTPCDVNALRNLARHDSRVDKHCKVMMAMVCGGFMEADSARTALSKFDVAYDELTALRYRGYGCPGPTTIETRDGRTVEMNYLDYWGEDESAWGLPPRCKICPDGIGDATDIAASDTWVGGAPPREGQEQDPGSNAVLVRTERGVQLMNRALSAGYLARGDSLSPDDMNRFQPHQENKKRSVWARYSALMEAGQVFPQTSGLRLQELHDANTADENQQQYRGAKLRIEQGKFSEDTPKSDC
jgi:coenzyme F420 hydrogenase subunit beta